MKVHKFTEGDNFKYCAKFLDPKADLELSIADRGGIRLYKGNKMVFEKPNEELSDLVEVVRFIETVVDPVATSVLMPAKKAREALVRVQLGIVEEFISSSIKNGYADTRLHLDACSERSFRRMPLTDLLTHLRTAGYTTSWDPNGLLVISW